MNNEYMPTARSWCEPPFDRETRREIQQLIDEGNHRELRERFEHPLTFGTGGLRGITGPGTARMNIYTVGGATKGLADFLLEKHGDRCSVVIARDSRLKSEEFARRTASILAAHGIRVYYFEEIAPTPLCSFAIRHLGATAGVVITASHNPPEYNGYKVYGPTGGQVIPPDDRAIIEKVRRVRELASIESIPFEAALEKGMITQIGEDVILPYMERVRSLSMIDTAGSDLALVFTPLHGTGGLFITRALEERGFRNVIPVPSQMKPDGNFPTLRYPNPEDPEAFDRALEVARSSKAELVLATDPDSDRIGLMYPSSGDYRFLSGNRIGQVLLYHLLTHAANNGDLPPDRVMVTTIVTSPLQEIMASDYGCQVRKVLTGFKWIARAMEQGGSVLFATEESHGYLPGDFLRDKDGISASCMAAELFHSLREGARTLENYLEEIFSRYGYHGDRLDTVTIPGLEGMDRMNKIMEAFRENPPEVLGGEPVTAWRDYRTGESRGRIPESVADVPSSNVLQFWTDRESRISMRPSGTEPKIKFYFSVREPWQGGDLQEYDSRAARRFNAFRADIEKVMESIQE
jgi:phosphomannomutase